MSETESFVSVMDTLLNGFTHDVRTDVLSGSYNMIAARLDRLKAAHDREIAQARDPQRLRGTKPDTFDGAIEALREFRWQHATNDEDAIPYINAVKEMHDREIRDVSQREFARGMNAGRHSMDAEHRAVAMRLRALNFADGRCHDSLNEIAHAVYPEYRYAWTHGSALRDKLIVLMGGVSDELSEPLKTINLNGEFNHLLNKNGDSYETGGADDTCDSQCCGACAAGDGRDSVEQAEVRDDCVDCDILGPDSRGHAVDCDFHELGVSDGGTADDSADDSRGGSRGKLVHMDGLVTYDVLDNERRKAVRELKAVCELRKCDDGYILEWDNIYEIFDALGVDYVGMTMAEVYENVRDRLIHLLGGDKPSGIDVLRAMDAESDTDGTCPNDDTTSSITDELRKWADGDVWSCKWEEFKAIADRIDEQFDRICAQQEAVLQSTIDGMVKEYEHDRLPDQLRIEKLEKQRDEARQECADLLDLLRDAVVDFEYASYSWNYATIVGENITIEMERNRLAKERDELQAKLDKASGENKGLRLSIDEQKESIAQRKKTIKKLARDNEKVWKTVHELQAKLDAIRDALDG